MFSIISHCFFSTSYTLLSRALRSRCCRGRFTDRGRDIDSSRCAVTTRGRDSRRSPSQEIERWSRKSRRPDAFGQLGARWRLKTPRACSQIALIDLDLRLVTSKPANQPASLSEAACVFTERNSLAFLPLILSFPSLLFSSLPSMHLEFFQSPREIKRSSAWSMIQPASRDASGTERRIKTTRADKSGRYRERRRNRSTNRIGNSEMKNIGWRRKTGEEENAVFARRYLTKIEIPRFPLGREVTTGTGQGIRSAAPEAESPAERSLISGDNVWRRDRAPRHCDERL